MDKALGYGDDCCKIAESPAPEDGKRHPEKDGKKRKLSLGEKQKMMIRELQEVFCKGRYRSWVLR
jgi:hypothetical protein